MLTYLNNIKISTNPKNFKFKGEIILAIVESNKYKVLIRFYS